MKKVGLFGGSFNPPTRAHTAQIAELLVFSVAGKLFFDEIWIVPCGDYRPDKFLQATAADRLAMMHLALDAAFPPGVFGPLGLGVEDNNSQDVEPLQSSCPHSCGVRVKTTELDRGAFIPTAELWRKYSSEYPSTEFWMLIGEDQVNELHTWHEADFLIQKVPFFVVPRPGYCSGPLLDDSTKHGAGAEPTARPLKLSGVLRPSNPKQAYGPDDAYKGHFAYIQSNISSTEVRKRIAHLRSNSLWSLQSLILYTSSLVCPAVCEYIFNNNLYI